MVVLERWSSYKKACIKQTLTKFGRFWQVLVFFSGECFERNKGYLNKNLQFRMFWSHSKKLKMFSVTFDFLYTYIKELQYNCSAHSSVTFS